MTVGTTIQPGPPAPPPPSTTPTAWDHLSILVGSAAAVAVGVADAWTVQRFGIQVDTGLVGLGLLGFGVKGTIGRPPL